jgi:ABC-type Fe3+ transport system substrate-binding protein
VKQGLSLHTFILMLAGLQLLCQPCLHAAQKKKEAKPKEPSPQEGKPYKAPPGVKKTVILVSPFDEGMLMPIVEFIDEQTGLTCRLQQPKKGQTFPDEPFDLYLGPLMKNPPPEVRPYDSPRWNGLDPSLHQGGLFTWSSWYSCLSLNTLTPVDQEKLRANALDTLFGKLTAIDPGKDLYTNAVLSALYARYGKAVVEGIAEAIPVYRSTRKELAFSVESGRNAAALGVEGFFRSSVARGYPLAIDFGSLNAGKYPTTTVFGKNVAFIARTAPNREGAEHLIDFMAEETFQSFLADTPFVPLNPEFLIKKGVHIRFPASVVEWTYDENELSEARLLWEGLAFPQGIKDLIR